MKGLTQGKHSINASEIQEEGGELGWTYRLSYVMESLAYQTEKHQTVENY